jgi:GntR family transcriptional repressor for pyruvate dehydrogenase complex
MSLNKKVNVTDKVFKYVRENISNGTWEVGSQIPTENELCQILEVSRISVRSALRPFISMNILESNHGKGTFVLSSDISVFGKKNYLINNLKDAIESLEFRAIIEPYICKMIAPNILDTVIEQLHSVQKRMVDSVGDSEKFVLADIEFHEILYREFGNSILESTLKTLYIQKLSVKTEINNAIGYYGGLYHHPLIINAL